MKTRYWFFPLLGSGVFLFVLFGSPGNYDRSTGMLNGLGMIAGFGTWIIFGCIGYAINKGINKLRFSRKDKLISN